MADGRQEKTVIRGTVEDVIFRSPDSDYAVIEVDCEGELITAVGELASVSEGEEITAFGQFVSHPTYGSQFRCDGCQITLPTTSAAILKFLSGRAIQGIGQVIARRLVEAFGDSTLEVMAKEPERLEKIKGLTRKKSQEISSEVSRIFGLTETVRNLSALGLGTGDSLLLYNAFGYDAASLISDNPYMLCEYPVYKEFTAADRLAEDLSIPESDFRRIRAALINTLRHNLGNGHTCLPTERLIDVTANYISVNRDDVEIELYRSAEEGVFCQLRTEEGDMTFLRDLYEAEIYIAERLRGLVSTRYFADDDAAERIDRFQKKTGIEYEPQQREAIIAALSSGAVVITGGPGTGKTTTVNAILALCEERGDRVALCAPTGRAAKRMTELTGKEARTIHRLLEVGYGSRENIRFIHNEENPL
ncbi:MAG: AAA family ATPase, partial [Oscillospiraceae bacterium]|nr:AAA family ATPase [Oscillospiraceae bacterium]